MTEEFVIGLLKDALWTVIQVAGPLLGISLAVGLVISALQAATQINEATLTFVPKAVAVLAVLALAGPWMLNTLISYTALVFNALPTAAR